MDLVGKGRFIDCLDGLIEKMKQLPDFHIILFIQF